MNERCGMDRELRIEDLDERRCASANLNSGSSQNAEHLGTSAARMQEGVDDVRGVADDVRGVVPDVREVVPGVREVVPGVREVVCAGAAARR
jgi:hypothetical protein